MTEQTIEPRTVRGWSVSPEVLDLVDDQTLADILAVSSGGECGWIRDRIGRPRSKQWQDWCVRYRVRGSAPGLSGQWLVGRLIPHPGKPDLADRGWFVIENDSSADLVLEAEDLADALLWARLRADGFRGPLFPDDPTGDW